MTEDIKYMKTQAYIDKIVENTGLSKKEIQDMVEEKKTELKGLISDEGALFIIAKELGVDVKEENREILEELEINISDVTANMKNLTLVGRIRDIYDIHEFVKKDGTPGIVGSFLLHDETGDIRIVLWNEQVKILQSPEFKSNIIVKVVNGHVKQGLNQILEVHIGRMGKLILNPEDVNYKKYPKITEQFVPIREIHLSLSSISIEGKILQVTPVNEFNKKDGSLGKVASLRVMDETGSIRVTFWNQDTEKLKNLEPNNVISITHLNPRINRLDSNKVDLHATSNTTIKIKSKEIEIQEPFLENIQQIQERENIISFKGVITSIDNLKNVALKSGETVSLLNFTVSDDTDSVRVVIWRQKAEELANTLKMGMGIALKNVLIRFNKFSNRKEITFMNGSEIEQIDLKIKDIKLPVKSSSQSRKEQFSGSYTKIKDISSPDIFEVKAYIAKEFRDRDIIIYEACSKCMRKPENCICEEKGENVKRMIIKTVLDDGTDTINTNFFGEKAEKLLGREAEEISDLVESDDFLTNLSKELMGRDLIVKGKGVFNDYNNINRYELNIIDFKNLDVDKELEKIMEEIET